MATVSPESPLMAATYSMMTVICVGWWGVWFVLTEESGVGKAAVPKRYIRKIFLCESTAHPWVLEAIVGPSSMTSPVEPLCPRRGPQGRLGETPTTPGLIPFWQTQSDSLSI